MQILIREAIDYVLRLERCNDREGNVDDSKWPQWLSPDDNGTECP
jgi:hypothetical protein